MRFQLLCNVTYYLFSSYSNAPQAALKCPMAVTKSTFLKTYLRRIHFQKVRSIIFLVTYFQPSLLSPPNGFRYIFDLWYICRYVLTSEGHTGASTGLNHIRYAVRRNSAIRTGRPTPWLTMAVWSFCPLRGVPEVCGSPTGAPGTG